MKIQLIWKMISPPQSRNKNQQIFQATTFTSIIWSRCLVFFCLQNVHKHSDTRWHTPPGSVAHLVLTTQGSDDGASAPCWWLPPSASRSSAAPAKNHMVGICLGVLEWKTSRLRRVLRFLLFLKYWFMIYVYFFVGVLFASLSCQKHTFQPQAKETGFS